MFFSHAPELIIVLVIALVVFGPKRLPELGSSLGKGIREFRKATSDLQESINVKPDVTGSLPTEQHHYTAASSGADYAPASSPVHGTTAEYTAQPPHGSDREPGV